MNETGTGAKQQIVEKVKASSNILITVSSNPSVDELSAALGLTLLLNKMNKHATAVFSGEVPPAINFLDPEKTFENTVDSLRDFIIALDKEKADHLRYKVDGDVVKIFITPYRTTITSEDLEFSQGDYNVELVLALGVKTQANLDTALEAHGRILHDATVASISVGEDKSELGSIEWRETNASSLSELMVSLSDSLKSDKPLLDEQIATAFLTGIVAATDRFSNNRTSSRAMTIAAQLMGAGANQQLIASKLEEAHEIGGESTTGGAGGENADGTTTLSENQATKLDKSSKKSKSSKAADGSLTISHEEKAPKVAPAAGQAPLADELEQRAEEVSAAKGAEAAAAAEQKLTTELQSVAPAATSASPSVADLQKDLAAAGQDINQAAAQPPSAPSGGLSGAVPASTWQNTEQPPMMGGTLNATTEQAAEDNRRAIEDDRNRTILTHGGSGYVGNGTPMFQSPINAAAEASQEPPSVDLFNEAPPSPTDTAPTAYAPPVMPPAPAASEPAQPAGPVLPPLPTPPEPTLAELDEQNRGVPSHEEARAAVDAAFGAVPFNPAGNPEASLGAQPLGDVPHDIAASPQPTGATSSLPPLPDFSTLPPLPSPPSFGASPSGALPPDKLEDVLAPAPPVPAPQSNDPGQFRIPGQG